MKIKGEAMETGAAETSVADHVRSMLHLMERGARVNLTDIPGDTTFLSSNFSGEASKAMAAHIKSALPHLSQGGAGVSEEALKKLMSYGTRLNDGRNDGTLFRFEGGGYFFLADQDALSPAPVRVTDDGQLPTRAEAAAAAKLLLRCNGFDLDQWGGGDLMDDFPMDALEALASHEPSPTDTQEGGAE